ncbi:MAG: hemin receptor [Devosiaceae bacterium]|nr:hemin receptor [Devosiaceae bacterium MH13]
MTEEQIGLVQGSFKQVAPIADTAAGLFYGRLFEIAPEVKPLFKGDMTEQGAKLMATLGVVVNGLSNPSSILPAAQALAVKHVEYGVTPAHYAPVGEALIWTLDQGLGDAFTDELKEAWVAAYTLLSGVMIDAAYPQAAE